MRAVQRLVAVALALGCAFPLAARAGQLGDFEHEVERPQGSRSDDWHDGDSLDCEGFFGCFLAVIFAGPAEATVRGAGGVAGEAVDWALFGPAHDEDREWLGTAAGQAAPPIPPQDPAQAVPLPERREPLPPPPPAPVPPQAAASAERHGVPGSTNRYAGEREPGSVTIPYLRVDNAYALIPDDVDAYSIQALAGYGAFAASFDFTRFWEDEPASRLDSYSADAVFRFAAGEVFEFDIATGYRGFRGEESHDGWEIGVPMAVFPWRYLGVEASFKWAFVAGNVVDDYRGGIALHLPFVTLRPGYRHLATGDESLDGPDLTLSVMW